MPTAHRAPRTRAELLAGAIDAGLPGRWPLDVALAGYERDRNEATMPDYHENLMQAQLRPPPREVLERLAGLRGDQEMVNRFFLAREGRIGQPSATK